MNYLVKEDMFNNYDPFDCNDLFSEYNPFHEGYSDDSNELFKNNLKFDFPETSADNGLLYDFPPLRTNEDPKDDFPPLRLTEDPQDYFSQLKTTEDSGFSKLKTRVNSRDYNFPIRATNGSKGKNVSHSRTSEDSKNYFQLTEEQQDIFNSMKLPNSDLLLPISKKTEKMIAQINRRIRNRKSAKRSRDTRKQKHLSLEMRVQELVRECDSLKDLVDYERDKKIEVELENDLLRKQGDYILTKLRHANEDKQDLLRNIDDSKKRNYFPTVGRVPYMIFIIFVSFYLIKSWSFTGVPQLLTSDGLPLGSDEGSDVKFDISESFGKTFNESLLKEHNYGIYSFSKRDTTCDYSTKIRDSVENYDTGSFGFTESDDSSPKRLAFDNYYGQSDFLYSPLKS